VEAFHTQGRRWCGVFAFNAPEFWLMVPVEGHIPLSSDKHHSRVIWDCAWALEGDIFATAARDKTVKEARRVSFAVADVSHRSRYGSLRIETGVNGMLGKQSDSANLQHQSTSLVRMSSEGSCCMQVCILTITTVFLGEEWPSH
jgi:hypothetical protein